MQEGPVPCCHQDPAFVLVSEDVSWSASRMATFARGFGVSCGYGFAATDLGVKWRHLVSTRCGMTRCRRGGVIGEGGRSRRRQWESRAVLARH